MDLFSAAMSGIESFGYFAVFLLIILGSLGLPLPEEPILLIAGYLASVGLFKIPIVLIIVVLSALIGDNLAYWIAKKKGIKFVMKHGEMFSLKEKHLKKAEKFFKNHGGKAVFFARFIIGFRFFGPILAGVSNMEWKKFQIYNFLGIIVWIPFVTMLGYLFGTKIGYFVNHISQLGNLILVTALIGLVVLLTWFLIREERD